ncbi:hypothetical protein [Sulfobacillus harzensis]|uniref:Uncharacterized protein n=1 Tax=Sulfobacillus harzensis TaxID=2729629 RepID=A0A7Y0Q0Z4_9FIRM|nr:hypothetical protein [Sulfobacillus harzensis]NMP20765.1 hypothetical protein [Sulfobacillus harzensis]
MGQQFSGGQISEVIKQQMRWVPRSRDVNGGGPQGGALVMPVYGQDVVWDALAITDTAAHPGMTAQAGVKNPSGGWFDPVYAVYKTLLVVSTLNEAVSIQPTWSLDGETYYPFGTATSVDAYSGSGNPATALVALSTPSQYLPYVNAIATCSTAPTSGTLTGTIARLG